METCRILDQHPLERLFGFWTTVLNFIHYMLLSQREAYANNPDKRKKKQDHYQENREVLSKEYRDKAREAKRNSTMNDKKYQGAIKIGPIFIFVCCHCSLFRENVLIFTDKMQKKIQLSILEDSCVFKENFKDPLGKGNSYVCHNC